MKESALIELHYLPSIQFFSKLLAYRQIIVEQHENYQKGSYRNRCRIGGANGLQVMSIPLEKGKHQKLPIREVRIAYAQSWHLQHWRSIQSAYANAPFFPYYSEPIQTLFEQKPKFLFQFNRQLFELLCQQLGLGDKYSYSTGYLEGTDAGMEDLREVISPKDQDYSQDPAFVPATYPQVFTERHGFLPNLSILDLLFCAGPQSLEILRASIRKD